MHNQYIYKSPVIDIEWRKRLQQIAINLTEGALFTFLQFEVWKIAGIARVQTNNLNSWFSAGCLYDLSSKVICSLAPCIPVR